MRVMGVLGGDGRRGAISYGEGVVVIVVVVLLEIAKEG